MRRLVLILITLSLTVSLNLEPALLFNDMTEVGDFLPLLYQIESQPFTEDVYIYINATPGHTVGVLYQSGSYGLEIDTQRAVYLACFSSSGFKSLTKSNGSIEMDTWTQLSIVYTPNVGVKIYAEGSQILSTDCKPPQPGHEERHHLLTRLGSWDTTPGKIYFRNFRFWKVAFSGSEVSGMKNPVSITTKEEGDLYVWAPMNDGQASASHVCSMIDYGPYGMHMRSNTTSLTYADIDTDLNEYVPSRMTLKPTTANVEFDISNVKFPTDYTIGFWMMYTTQSLGAEILSGSKDAANCPKDTIVTLSNPGNWGIKLSQQRFALQGPVNEVRHNVNSWEYHYWHRDRAVGGTCGTYTTSLSNIATWVCTNNNFPFFCNKIIFYTSAASPSFKNFQVYFGFDAINKRYLAYTKYITIYIYIYSYFGYKSNEYKVLHFPFSETGETPFRNWESENAPLISTHSAADHVEDATIKICPPGTLKSTGGASCILCNYRSI